jgi:hypothetical protein
VQGASKSSAGALAHYKAGSAEKKGSGNMLPRWSDSDRGERSRTFKVDCLLLLALSIVIVGLWIPRSTGPLDLRWDGAVYYVLGTSIAEGKGYRLLHEPGEIEAILYPPLLPLLAAVPQTVLGTRDPVIVGRWLKLFFFCFHASLVLATYFMLRIFVPRWLAFWGALALLLNVQVIFHSNLFFAEIPFGLATVLFVLCNRRSSNRVHETLAAVFAVTAFLLRTAGVALLAAWVAESLAQKQFKRAAVRLLISAIPVLCWSAYVWQVERSPSYVTPAYPYQRAPYLNYNVSYATNFSLVDAYSPGSSNASARQLAQRFWQNSLGMGVTLGEAVSDSRGFWRHRLTFRGQRFPFSKMVLPRLFYIPLILLGGLCLGGMVVLIRRGEVFIPVYVLATVMLLCATPWPEQFRRYLVPVAPFLLASLFSCVLGIGNWLRMSRRKLVRKCAPVALLIVLALIFDAELNSLHAMYRYHLDRVRSETYNGSLVDYRLFYYSSASKSLDDGLDWLQQRAKPGDVMATSMPHWAYLRKGLKAVRPPLESNRERTQALLDSVPVAYIVLSPKSDGKAVNNYILPFVQGNSQAWKCVYVDEERLVLIYERVRSEDEDKGKQ